MLSVELPEDADDDDVAVTESVEVEREEDDEADAIATEEEEEVGDGNDEEEDEEEEDEDDDADNNEAEDDDKEDTADTEKTATGSPLACIWAVGAEGVDDGDGPEEKLEMPVIRRGAGADGFVSSDATFFLEASNEFCSSAEAVITSRLRALVGGGTYSVCEEEAGGLARTFSPYVAYNVGSQSVKQRIKIKKKLNWRGENAERREKGSQKGARGRKEIDR